LEREREFTEQCLLRTTSANSLY